MDLTHTSIFCVYLSVALFHLLHPLQHNLLRKGLMFRLPRLKIEVRLGRLVILFFSMLPHGVLHAIITLVPATSHVLKHSLREKRSYELF
jgi:hypothetical protein